jgi:hypothetical protein
VAAAATLAPATASTPTSPAAPDAVTPAVPTTGRPDSVPAEMRHSGNARE